MTDRGPGRLYALVRVLASLGLGSWFRLHVSGAEHVPERGAAVVVANHKSFLDPVFLVLATRRTLRYMAKAELFRPPLGWLLVRVGAFPVRRGEADADALATARAILDGGGVVVVFPEGTRVDERDALGSPHHGAGRLARATGAPIVPTAIRGTSHLWLGPIPKPRRIDVSFLAPVDADADELIDARVWPAVQEEYGRLRATPGAIGAALAAAGLGGALVRRQVRRDRRPRVLGIVEPRRLRRQRRSRLAQLRAAGASAAAAARAAGGRSRRGR